MKNNSNKIYIAKLGKTVGLKGQQKLHIDSDFPEQFQANAQFVTDKNQILVIETYSSKSNTVKFKGIDTIESAKKLTNRQLFVSQEDTISLCNLNEKQFFWFDMIGCTIIENEQVLGIVNDIQRMPLSDYLQIDTSKELVESKLPNNFLIPYIDDYILNVDIGNKIITTQNSKDILEAS